MKHLLSIVFSFLFCTSLIGQQLSVEFDQQYKAFGANEFPTKQGVYVEHDHAVIIEGEQDRVEIQTPISTSLSRNGEKAGVIVFNQTLEKKVVEYTGKELSNTELEYIDASDQTLQVTQFDNGQTVIRENVANFTFFDASGNLSHTISNSVQSSEGEQVSEIAANRSGSTVILYNPVIDYGTERGSRAAIALADQEKQVFFNSGERSIDDLKVSAGGLFVTMVTSEGNEASRFHLFDRFGNQILEKEVDMNLKGASVTEDGQFATIFSDNRIQAYRTEDWQRLGSSTSQTRIVFAAYQPSDDVIISLGGRLSENQLRGFEVTAIDIEGRQLDTQSVDGSISVLRENALRIERETANRYRIAGINRPLIVTTNF